MDGTALIVCDAQEQPGAPQAADGGTTGPWAEKQGVGGRFRGGRSAAVGEVGEREAGWGGAGEVGEEVCFNHNLLVVPFLS